MVPNPSPNGGLPPGPSSEQVGLVSASNAAAGENPQLAVSRLEGLRAELIGQGMLGATFDVLGRGHRVLSEITRYTGGLSQLSRVHKRKILSLATSLVSRLG